VTVAIFIFSVSFIIGITFVPLICGTKYLIAKIRSPGDPPELSDPSKPVRPIEPKIGAKSEEWIAYRKGLTQYRAAKAKWKEELERKRANERRLRNAYDENKERRDREARTYRSRVLLPARKSLCKNFEFTTSQIFFMREETPTLIRFLLKSYYTIRDNFMASYS